MRIRLGVFAGMLIACAPASPPASVPDAAVPSVDASLADAGADDAGPTDAGRADAGFDAGAGVLPDAGLSCPVAGLPPGDHTLGVIVGGLSREAKVHVPPAAAQKGPLPVVLNFHGAGSNPQQQADITRLFAKADQAGFIAVHPQGWNNTWNAGSCCTPASNNGIDDVAFVRALVMQLSQVVCVDAHRVYAFGASNGAFLVHRLGCEASDLFAAIVPVAGMLLLAPSACRPTHPMPVLYFHGTRDPLVPYGGSALLGFPSAQSSFAQWAALDNCTDSAAPALQVSDAKCSSHRACAGGAEVTHCAYESGHDWPGGQFSVQGISATDYGWSFMQRFRR